MPILFGTLTAIVMAIALWTTYKNQTEFEKQIGLKEIQERALAENSSDLRSRKDELQNEINTTESLIAENKTLVSELEKIDSEIAQIKSNYKQKGIELEELKRKREAAEAAIQDLGDIESIIAQIESLNTEVAQLKDSIEKEEANLTKFRQAKKTIQAKITLKVTEAERIASGKSQARLATTINTVYSSWGFVTLNGGDSQGVVPDSILDVVRDNEVIAKLKVTTVEPNKAAADIVRGSVNSDMLLQSGDTVRAEKEEIKKPAKKDQLAISNDID